MSEARGTETVPTIDALVGSGTTLAHFDMLDMAYRLRMRAFVGICMPPIFRDLEDKLQLMSLRRTGIAPVMFYLDFRSGETPVAFLGELEHDHSLRFYRSISDRDNRPAAEGVERLLFASRTVIRARARSHGPESLGFDDGSGGIIEAGSAEIMHMITRPVAEAGSRQVIEVPEPLRRMREHRWEAPLPSVDGLQAAVQGYVQTAAGDWEMRTDVWGLPNTDVNQHVNVQEYIMGGENQFSRLLCGAGLDPARHHIGRARLLFRKPFFPGQSYRLQSKLYRSGHATRMQAGFFLLENGTPAPRASTFVVFDGRITD